MNTKQAIQAMLDGKKVKKSSWGEQEYILLSSDGYVIDNYGSTYSIQNANDWEIYEEPKPVQTVTIEKWLCIEDGENYCIYEGDANYFNAIEIFATKKVKLLDTYEVTL